MTDPPEGGEALRLAEPIRANESGNFEVQPWVWNVILAALRSPAPRDPHEPGESHEYRVACIVCGQRGVVQLSIEPQAAETNDV